MSLSNLFADLALLSGSQQEQFTELLSRPGVRIERIVSTGQASEPGVWYDSPRGEWVLLVQGEARLVFEDEQHLTGSAGVRLLKPGDFIDIAPHRRHRVAWTHPSLATVWLAVHYDVD